MTILIANAKDFSSQGQKRSIALSLKLAEAKILVKELDIEVDGVKEDRRGRKLYPNTKIVIKNYDTYFIV